MASSLGRSSPLGPRWPPQVTRTKASSPDTASTRLRFERSRDSIRYGLPCLPATWAGGTFCQLLGNLSAECRGLMAGRGGRGDDLGPQTSRCQAPQETFCNIVFCPLNGGYFVALCRWANEAPRGCVMAQVHPLFRRAGICRSCLLPFAP